MPSMDVFAGEVDLHVSRVAARWSDARTQRKPCAFVQQVNQLTEVQRKLSRRAETLPRTVPAERLRRRCVEQLQAERQQLEALGLKREALDDRLHRLAARRLEVLEGLLASPRSIARMTLEPSAPLIVMVLMLAVSTLTWGWRSDPISAGCVAIAAVLTQIRVQVEFDGRFLRTAHRLFGVICSATAAVDLVEFNKVVLTDFEATEPRGETYPRTAVSLVSSEAERMVRDTTPGAETDQLGAQLREWCAAAAREQA